MKSSQTRRVASWDVSDAVWHKVAPLIPTPHRDPNRTYQRKPGGGQKPLPPRQVFAGIVYVLRTSIQWNAFPKERVGSPSAIHRYVLQWQAAGVFARLWQAGLMKDDERSSIAWTWQRVDGALTNAPLAQEAVGPNPTDRGKTGSKRSLLVDGRGIPLALVVNGAEIPDVVLPATLAVRILRRRDPGNGTPQSLSGDKGSTGETAWAASQRQGDTPALLQRGQTTRPGARSSAATVAGGTVSDLAQSLSKGLHSI
ncbi:IS5 family transposase [candidate division KSB3 bacterium]|uniref:IS5 family transposase n=1 Tax=candidate division KSB3 bacterium TaxID=2044937 RepID=A0A9D5Q5Z7_9BACT|nr:IS5 family transposase [candidate division KSB3 bacterium]MBD3324762.1 IS5 family transposase [candidate division KSB3 bacterium]